MTLGLIGQKCGMTRIFTAEGASMPVTVVEVKPNRIVAVKTLERDGYRAVQVTTGSKRASKISKAVAGQFINAGVDAGCGLWEFRLDENEEAELNIGAELKVDLLNEGTIIDVSCNSKGKGFAGVVKRHNFKTQDASHGNSLSHRAPGSIGQCQDPGKVFKGKKMAGHMGNKRCTIQNQEIVSIDSERNLLLIKGGIPGAKGSFIIIKPAIKMRGKN